VAAICPEASEFLGAAMDPGEEGAMKAGQIAAGELSFGDDLRAGAEYRRAVCPVLVARAIREACE
jgi:CO/xanthine dehydrogenase FAD-binding subunit